MRRRMIFIAPLALLGLVAFATIGGVVVRQLWKPGMNVSYSINPSTIHLS